MMDESTLQKFYREVPAAHLDRFRNFLRTHSLERLKLDCREVTYCACGRGAARSGPRA